MSETINEAGANFNFEDTQWVWVLTNPQAQSQDQAQDNIFALVMELDGKEGQTDRRIVPVFQSRENADGLKTRLGAGSDYQPHTILLKDVGHFAVQHDLEIMLLDQAGVILAHLEARLEQAMVH